MGERFEVALGDVIEIKHGYAFSGKLFSDDVRFPTVITPRNFATGGGFKDAAPKTFLGDYPEEFELKPGDLVISMTDLSKDGATLGLPALIPSEGKYLHNQRIGLVRISDESMVNLIFLNYYLRMPTYRAYILSTASGSTVRHTSPKRIADHVVELPTLSEQQAIAEVLGALDDKIDANERLVVTADQLAATVLTAQLSRDDRPLHELADIVMGSSPPGSSYNEEGVGLPFYQGIRDFGFRFPSRRVWTTEPSRLVRKTDTIVSVRAPVGNTNLCGDEMCIGRGLAALSSKSGRPMTLFHQVRAASAAWAPYKAEGTVFGSINKKQLEDIRIPVVSDGSKDDVEMRLQAIEDRIVAALVESERLASTRDELIPLLMSGKIRVKDAEKVVEEAT